MSYPTARVTPQAKTESRVPVLIAVALLTAMWGFAQLDFTAVLYQLTGFFTMTPAQVNSIPAVLNITYFLIAIPAAMFHRRFGYKLGIIAGLSVSSFGPFLLYPAMAQQVYPFFAASVMIMTIGWPFLETCLNPLATELGSRQTAVRRLCLMQSFYPVGTVIGVFVAQWLLRFDLSPSAAGSAEATARPFLVVGITVLLLALTIDKVRFPADASGKNATPIREEFRQLLRRKEILIGLAAIFCCQLAQATTWGTLNYYAQEEIGTKGLLGAETLLTCGILAGVGRFSATGLMGWVKPVVLLGIAMFCGLVLIVSSAAFGGQTGFNLLVTTSLFMAVAYPVIFGTVIAELGALKAGASGLLVTAAGMGSAFELLVVNTSHGTIPIRYVVLSVVPCFVMVLVFAIRRLRSGQTLTAQ